MQPSPELGTALERLRSDPARRLDDGKGPIWLATLGQLVLPLPNFRWRREALDIHDTNHLLTGFGFSAADECRLASWELGARCYSSIWARLLCLFLLMVGVLMGPRAVLAAFRAGRKHRKGRINAKLLE